jgi:hypothetical protein
MGETGPYDHENRIGEDWCLAVKFVSPVYGCGGGSGGGGDITGWRWRLVNMEKEIGVIFVCFVHSFIHSCIA